MASQEDTADTSAPSSGNPPPSDDGTVPAPRRPGKGQFRWSDVLLPIVISGLALGAVLLLDIEGTTAAAATIVVFVILAIALGRRIGRREVRAGWFSDLVRGALTAELLTLGLAAVFVVWSHDSQGGYNQKSFIFPLVFAHVLALPPLLFGAAFGVSLGVGTTYAASLRED